MSTILFPFQALFFIFLTWPLSRLWLRFKEGKVRFTELLFWSFVWLTASVAVLFPGVLTSFANLLGVGRGADLLIYFSIIVLFYLIFRLNIMVENLQNDISKVVREVALQNEKLQKKSK
jgi:small membrane protein